MKARWLLAVLLLTAACGSAIDTSGVADLPEATTADILATVRESGTPAVLNVWASWCGPCRAEAPLLDAAAKRFQGTVDFIGLNVRDSQAGAKAFIAEFVAGAPINHLFDRDGSVVADLGGTSGVPLTFFMGRDGSVAKIHFGVIDERTLALEIDELIQSANP